MPVGTPGRPHVPYNTRPKEVGSRTGAQMPKNVPLTSEGFEDPSLFFRSPTGTIVSTSRRTTLGGISNAPSSVAGTSRGRMRPSMMSLVGNDDDDDGDNNGFNEEEFDLRDGEEGFDETFEDVGPTYFAERTHTSISLPRKSQLPPRTPTSNFDDVPSPNVTPRSARRSTMGTGLGSASSNRRLTTNTSRLAFTPPPSGMDTDYGLESTQLNDDEDDDIVDQSILGSGNKRSRLGRNHHDNDDMIDSQPIQKAKKGKRPIIEPEEEEEEEEEVEEPEKTSRTSKNQSLSKSKGGSSTARNRVEVDLDHRADIDGNEDEDEEEEEMTAGNESLGFDGGVEFDDINGDAQDMMEEEDDVPQQGDHDEEEEEEEEEVERQPLPQKRTVQQRSPRRQPIEKKVVKKKTVTSGSGEIAARALQGKKRTRVSTLPNGDGDGFTGDFVSRRSGRRHFAPLAYWRGEKVEYQAGPGLPVVKELLRFEADEVIPLGARHRKSYRNNNATSSNRRSASRSEALGGSGGENEFLGMDEKTSQYGTANEWEFGKEAERRLAMPYSSLQPKQVKDADFKYQKVFGEGSFVAAGVVFIPPGCEKPVKPSKDNAYIFFVRNGVVDVTIHTKTYVLATGAMFMIPRGNMYSIKNIADVQAELFFTQSRKLIANEAEKLALENAEKKKKSASQSFSQQTDGEGEGEDGEDGETDKTPVSAKKKRRV